MPADARLIKAGEEETLQPDTLGAAGSRYYIIKNGSATEGGSYRVVID